MTNGRPSVNFSLHNTTGPSSATPAGGTGLAAGPEARARRRSRPVRSSRRSWRVAARGRRGRRLQRPRHEQAHQGPVRRRQSDRVITYHGPAGRAADHRGRGARQPGKLQERGRLLPGRGPDDDHHDRARRDAGQEGRGRLRARLGGPQRSAHQPADHDQERRGQLPERQADPRGRRDRRHRVRRGHLQAGPRRPSRARSSWPSPT